MQANSCISPLLKSRAIALTVKENNRNAYEGGDFQQCDFGENALFVPDLYFQEIFRGLICRGRLQAAVLQTFLKLCNLGICSLTSLTKPVWYHTSELHQNKKAYWIYRYLLCHTGLHMDDQKEQRDWDISEEAGWWDFDEPVQWLAIMIARSADDCVAAMKCVTDMKYVGAISLEALDQLPSTPSEWNAIPDLAVSSRAGATGGYGFWLPDGVDIGDGDFDRLEASISNTFYGYLEPIENLHKEVIGLTSDL
jgi:hypothetical protein